MLLLFRANEMTIKYKILKYILFSITIDFRDKVYTHILFFLRKKKSVLKG